MDNCIYSYLLFVQRYNMYYINDKIEQKAAGSESSAPVQPAEIKHNPITRFSTSPCSPLQVPTNTKFEDTLGYQQFLGAEFKSVYKTRYTNLDNIQYCL